MVLHDMDILWHTWLLFAQTSLCIHSRLVSSEIEKCSTFAVAFSTATCESLESIVEFYAFLTQGYSIIGLKNVVSHLFAMLMIRTYFNSRRESILSQTLGKKRERQNKHRFGCLKSAPVCKSFDFIRLQ